MGSQAEYRGSWARPLSAFELGSGRMFKSNWRRVGSTCADRFELVCMHTCIELFFGVHGGHGERHVGHGGREVPYGDVVGVGGQLWYEGC